MARYHKAEWKPVTRYAAGGANHVPMTARRLVLHTAVTNGSSLFALFNTPGNPVAHFYVRQDGSVEQYVDTDIRSSAVLEGNHDCITVETWDGYPSTFRNGEPPVWNDAQVRALADIAAWVHAQHSIPLVKLSSSRPGTQGVGWHRQGIDGNWPYPAGSDLGGRAPGGELWSPSAGKSCPGTLRINQVPSIIALANDPTTDTTGDTDMVTTDDLHQIRQIVADEVGKLAADFDKYRAHSAAREKEMLALIKELTQNVKGA